MPHRSVDHSNDAVRAAAVARYGLLAEGPPRPALVALAELAAQVCGVSSAFISVVTDDELLQLATTGFEGFTVPRAISMCDAVLQEDEPLVSADLSHDPRFHDNDFVRSGRAVFYASYQLTTPDGVPFGSLCVYDDHEREIDDAQRRALHHLADRVVDVLELDVRNRELAASNDELERSNQQLAAFAGQVSHDLRNPLGALSGTLELLSGLVDEPETDVGAIRLLLGRAQHSTERMARLLEEVLQFATLGGRLDVQVVDVARLVDEVREDLATALLGATLTVGSLDDVLADPVQLRVVVQNLLSNAAKYRTSGEAARIEVSARTTQDTWRLTVVDHGRGVAPADRRRAFDPFVRVDAADGEASAAVSGSGMGLATSRRIVRAHQGRIGLDETPGGGTTAWLELPAQTAEPRQH